MRYQDQGLKMQGTAEYRSEELEKQRKAGYQRRGKEAEKRRISKYRTKKQKRILE